MTREGMSAQKLFICKCNKKKVSHESYNSNKKFPAKDNQTELQLYPEAKEKAMLFLKPG